MKYTEHNVRTVSYFIIFIYTKAYTPVAVASRDELAKIFVRVFVYYNSRHIDYNNNNKNWGFVQLID